MRKIALNPKKAVIKGLFVMRTKRYALFIFRAYQNYLSKKQPTSLGRFFELKVQHLV